MRTSLAMVQKDAVHSRVIDVCLARLAEHGAFQKEDVLATAQVYVGRDNIRWDLIAKLIYRTVPGMRLVGARASYFLPKRASTSTQVALLNSINMDPKPYYARGHKEAAGYVACTNTKVQALIAFHVRRLKTIADGINRSADDVEEALRMAAQDDAPACPGL